MAGRSLLRRYLALPLLVAVACSAASVGLPVGVGPIPEVPVCDHPSESAAAAAPTQPSSEPLLTVGWEPSTDRDYLVERDPATLEPTSGRLSLGEQQFHFYAFSPDGTQVAVASRYATIRVFDLAPLRLAREVHTASGLGALIWPQDDFFVGVWQRGGGPHDSGTLKVDAITGKSLARTKFPDTMVDAQSTARGELVALTTANQDAAHFGPARVIVVGTDGEVRSRQLDQIESGYEVVKRARRVGVQKVPGLAIDPTGERAFVAGKNEPVAEVDLDSLEITYHVPQAGTSLFDRLGALVSPAEAKGALGWYRFAEPIGDRLLAITGYDSKARGGGFPEPDAAGIQLVDTVTWKSCMWNTTSGRIDTDGDSFFVWRDSTSGAGGNGLSAYDLAGRLRWHAFGDRDVDGTIAGDYLYVRHGWDTIREYVVDPATGRVLHDGEVYLTEIVTPGPVRFLTAY